MSELICTEIKRQAEGVGFDCDKATARNSFAATFWNRWNLILGGGAALLAALAALAAAADSDALEFGIFDKDYIIAVLTVLSASAASNLTFLKPSEKAAIFHEFAVNYRALRERCRIFCAIDCLQPSDVEKLRKSLDGLLKDRDELNKKCPIASNRAYAKAKDLVEKKPRYKNLADRTGAL